MATLFYSRTLPAPRFVNVNGGTWTTLGVSGGDDAIVPPAYVEGDETVYLVQVVLQRTSQAGNIRLNLDTFISGSGGAEGPDFINLVETRGLIRLSYGDTSRAFDIADSAIDDDAEPYAWQFRGVENSAWMHSLLNALVADSTIPLTIEFFVPDGTLIMRAGLGRPEGVRRRTGEAEGLSVQASVGRPKANVIGQAEGIAAGASVGNAEGYVGVGYAEGLTVEVSHRQPDALAHPFAYIEFLHLEPLGVRSRTRSGGSVWEWNNLDLAIPYPVGDSTHITVVRVRSNQLRVTGPDNTLAGLGADFIRHGDLILYSPAAGEFHIDPLVGRFNSQGRINLSGDEWDAWWTAFSADATNELTVEWFFHGLEPVVSVGRPTGVKDRTKYGLPFPLPQEQAVGRPGSSTTRATRPITLNVAPGRPHAYAHAEFIQLDMAVGRPNAEVKRAIQPIALDHAAGRPNAQVKRAVQPIALEHAVGMPDGRTQVVGEPMPLAFEQAVGMPQPYAHVAGIALEQSVSRPRGYIPKVAARSVSIEQSLSRPHAYAHAEFIQTDLSVGRPNARVKRAVNAIAAESALGRPAAILYGVPGGEITGTTVSESHDFGVRALVRSNGTWQFNANLTLPEPIMTATASPIAQAHLRANQVRFLRTGGQNPGFSDEFLARGRVTWTRVGGTSFTIVAPPFDHIGRYDPSSLDGWSAWWTAFSVTTASELSVTWEMETGGFQPSLTFEAAVGRPEGRTSIAGEPMPLALELAVSEVHAFAHAEFIQANLSVGRPRGYIPAVAAQGISSELDTTRPHAFAHSEFVASALSVGRPRGYIPAVAAMPISSEMAATMPIPYAVVRGITAEIATDMPDGDKKRVAAGRAIALEASPGRPRGYLPAVAALPVAQEGAVGAAVALVKRAINAIAAESVTGRPHAHSHGRELVLEAVTGQPRGYLPSVAALGIASELAPGRPHAYAHAEFIQLDMAVGRPNVEVKRAIQGIASEQALGRPVALVRRAVRGIAAEMEAGRPHIFLPGTEVALELAVGRPRGYIAEVAALGIASELVTGRVHAYAHAEFIQTDLSVGRPNAQVKRAVEAIAVEMAAGQPHAFAHAQGVALELAPGRPRGYIAEVAALGIALTLAVGRPQILSSAEGVAAELAVGRPVARVKRAVEAIAAESALGRPHAYAHGTESVVEAAVGRPNAFVTRATQPIRAALSVGMPLAQKVRVAAPRELAAEQATGKPYPYPNIGEATVAQDLSRPVGLVRVAAVPIEMAALAAMPRGYLPSVAGLGVVMANDTGLVRGERLRAARGREIAAALDTGRPLGFFQAQGAGIYAEMLAPEAQRYFPRRNPEHEERAGVQAVAATHQIDAPPALWQIEAE